MKTPSDMWHKAWPDDGAFVRASAQNLERLIEAARADEREAMRNEVHSCGPSCTNAACVAVREAVVAEREAIKERIIFLTLDYKSDAYYRGWLDMRDLAVKSIEARPTP